MVKILTAQLVVSCCIHGAKWPALTPGLAPPLSLQGLVLHYHPITHDTSQNTQGGNVPYKRWNSLSIHGCVFVLQYSLSLQVNEVLTQQERPPHPTYVETTLGGLK